MSLLSSCIWKRPVLILAVLLSGGGLHAADIRVSILHDAKVRPDEQVWGGLHDVLAQVKGFAPAYGSDVTTELLANTDVLVVSLLKYNPDAAARNAAGIDAGQKSLIEKWVCGGGGLLCYNDSVGFTRHQSTPIFPEVAEGIANPFPDQEGYARECVVTRAHPVTQGLQTGDRFVLSYFDYIALQAGPGGVPVVRSVAAIPRGGVVNDPIVVCGTIGRGRYVANGMFSGLDARNQPVPLEAGEKALLINAIRWLAGGMPEPPGGAMAEKMVKGEVLPPRNLVLNPSCEVLENGKPAHWSYYLSTGKLEFGAHTNAAHSGKMSAGIKVAGYRFSEGGVNQVGGALLAGESDGYTGRNACRVQPRTLYHFSFWIKGDIPSVNVMVFEWPADGGASDRKTTETSLRRIVPTSTWVRYAGQFATGPDTEKIALAWHFAGDDKQKLLPLNTALYVDDVELTQGEKISVTSEIRDRSTVFMTSTWNSATAMPDVAMERVAPGTPIAMSREYLAFPHYDPLPDGWRRIDLAGLWRVRKLPGTATNPPSDEGTQAGYWRTEYDDADWQVRPVPGSWDDADIPEPEGKGGVSKNRSGANHFTGVGWYRRSFNVPALAPAERVVLHCEGVADESVLWINGREVGRHCGGHVPFAFDVTDAVKPGAPNLLAMRVFDAETRTTYELGGAWNECYLTVNPQIHARRMLLAPQIAAANVVVDTWLVNPGSSSVTAQVAARIHSYPTPWAKGPRYDEMLPLGSVNLDPGVNRRRFTVPMRDPVCWSTTNPFLYVLELKVGDQSAGKTRFGFREFKTDQSYFLLNGRREWLRALQYHHLRVFDLRPDIVIYDQADFMKRYLMAMKSYNVNMIYALAVVSPRLFYDLCDELGILIYDEWVCAGSGTPVNTPIVSEPDLGEIDAWVYLHHNHPSIVMRSLGGELFERYKPPTVKTYKEYLDPLYDRVKALDMQNRPLCVSSGRHLWIQGGKTDFCDLHFYPGGISGSWTEEAAVVGNVWDAMLTMYGREMPLIQFEFNGLGRTLYPEEAAARKAGLSAQGNWNRQAFIELVEKPPAWDAWTRALTGLNGLRLYLAGNDLWERYGVTTQQRIIKNALEEVRRCGDLLQGVAPYLDGFEITEVLVDGKLLNNREYARGRLDGNLAERVFVASEAYADMRRVYNPWFVCLDLFDHHVFAGGALKARVYAMNDTQSDSSDWRVRMRVRAPDGRLLDDRLSEIGRVASFKRMVFPYVWTAPAELVTGFYRVELYLYENDRVISDNAYPFYVLGRGDAAAGIATSKKVALYDRGREIYQPEETTTTDVLAGLRLPADRIADFTELDAYQVLIVGAGSLDPYFASQGDRIRQWIAAGGRLLQFEQFMGGAIPYLPQLQIIRNYPNILSEMVIIEHPVFKGMTPDMLDRWNGTLPEAPGCPGAVFVSTISPLNEAAVATGCMDVPRNTTKAIRMTVADVQIGKGMALLVQLEATRRYGRDAVATRFIQNALEYIVSDDTTFSAPLATFALGETDMNQCALVDLNRFGMYAFGEGGLAWLGDVRTGRQEYHGVVFDIPREGKPLGRSEKLADIPVIEAKLYDAAVEQTFKDSHHDLGGLQSDFIEKFYFLHACNRVRSGELAGRYILAYTDGSQAEYAITGGVNILSCNEAAELPNAIYAGNGAYLAVWDNPYPHRKIKSLDLVVTGSGQMTVLGITCKLVRGKVHD